MGNQLTVSAGVVPDVTTSFRDLSDHELDRILHSTRFMKVCINRAFNFRECFFSMYPSPQRFTPYTSQTVRTKHRNGLHLVKVFVKQDAAMDLRDHQLNIERIRFVLIFFNFCL